MSRLEELIGELCPDGVEYKSVSDICSISRGRVMSKDYIKNNQGEYPVFSSQTENGGIFGYISAYDFDGEYITWTTDGANAGSIFYHNEKFSITNVCGLLKVTKPDISIKFLYYVLSTTAKSYVNSGMGNPKLMSNVMGRIRVPIPLLEIQNEIVRILDNFTGYTTELTTELTTEFTARKQQYEYYQKKLLTFNQETAKRILWKKLGDICTLKAGNAIPTNIISDEKTNENCFPCYGGNGRRGYVNIFNESGEKSIIGRQGATCGNVCYVNGNFYATEHAVVVTNKGYFNDRFLFHLLRQENLNQYKTAGAQPGLSVTTLNSIKVPVPPMDIQNKIAYVLDNFDSICSDLNIEPPAEIKARQKQYEYYRDKLLKFDSSVVTISRQTGLIKLYQYVYGYCIVELRDLVTVFRGEYINKKGEKKGNIPVLLGGKEPAYYINRSNHTGEIVVVARSGVSAGFVSYWDEPIFITDGFGYEADQNLILSKYLYYTLKHREKELNSMKRGAGVPHISGEAILSLKIPVPSLYKQKQIVSILDQFDTLCNDLSSGIPAEIEARKKQYEYYREKLLTFKEKIT